MQYTQRHADFNESTFGTQLTAQIQNWLILQGDFKTAAIQPTLAEEADYGYDVKFPAKWGILYLQYKMPQFLRGNNASEYRYYNGSYFRFPVKTDRTQNGKIQHNVLCDLESRGQEVFYAAPCFLTGDELTAYVLSDEMCENSVFPRPSQLGLVAEKSLHRYAYTGERDIRAFSQPGPEFTAGVETLATSLRQKIHDSESIPLARFLEDTLVDLIVSVGNLETPGRTILQRIALLSNSVGLQPILVREVQLDEDVVLTVREGNSGRPSFGRII